MVEGRQRCGRRVGFSVLGTAYERPFHSALEAFARGSELGHGEVKGWVGEYEVKKQLTALLIVSWPKETVIKIYEGEVRIYLTSNLYTHAGRMRSSNTLR